MASPASSSNSGGTKKRGCPSWQNSIERGKACLACRTRKVKCNGERPVCSGCTKLRHQHGADDDVERYPCEYEDLPPGTKKTRVSRKMVQTLEEKVAALEDEIARLPPPPLQLPPSFVDVKPNLGGSGSDQGDYGRPSSSNGSPPDVNYLSPSSGYSSATTASSIPSSSKHAFSWDSLPPLIPSAYSPYLPGPLTLKKIVVLFLNSDHPCKSLFSPKTFFHRLTRPPGDVEYPHDALLHAMVALAVELHGDGILEGQKIPQKGVEKTEAAHWHAARARDLAHQGAITCDRFFDTLQAVILMSAYAHRICRFQDIWQLTGLGARVAVALRLNKLAPYTPNHKYEYCAYTNAAIEIVRIPRDVSDVTERRMAFWWTLAAERFATANTGWAMVIQDDDITTMLPSASPDQADGDDDWKATSITSPEFFVSHPTHLVGGVQLFFKATVLLGRGSIINQRSPRFAEGVKVDKTADEVRRSDEFQLLERQISDYLISTSGFPADNPLDIYTPFVACLPYVARILAHEPLCTFSQGDRSMMLCMDAARRIEATVSQAGMSGTASELLPFLTFCWTVAGRTLIRQLAIKQAWEDKQGVPELKNLIDRLLDRIASFRSPNAKNAHDVLSNFVRNPSILLPPPPKLAIAAPPPPPPPPPVSTHMAQQYQLSPPVLPQGMPPASLSPPVLPQGMPPASLSPPVLPQGMPPASLSPPSHTIRPRQYVPGPNFPLPNDTPSAFAFERQAQAEAEMRGEARARREAERAQQMLLARAQQQQQQAHVQQQQQQQQAQHHHAQAQAHAQATAVSVQAQDALRRQHLERQRQQQQRALLREQEQQEAAYMAAQTLPPPPSTSSAAAPGYYSFQATPQSLALLEAEQYSHQQQQHHQMPQHQAPRWTRPAPTYDPGVILQGRGGGGIGAL